MVPTLLEVSLVGGFLGACLYRWFQRAFSRPEEPVSLATEGSSMSLIEQVPSSAGAARATWAGIGWGYIWRLGLAGLVSFIITGLLLHTRISMYFTPILFIPAPLFSRPLIELDITFSPGDWLIPSSFVTLFSIVPFLARFPIFSLIFLPFVLPFPGILIEHTLWKNRTIFPGLGIVLVFLGMAIGAKDLLLTLLEYLNSFWPFGTGSALFYCAALLCETTALALLAALAQGNAQKPISRWNQRLLWPAAQLLCRFLGWLAAHTPHPLVCAFLFLR